MAKSAKIELGGGIVVTMDCNVGLENIGIAKNRWGDTTVPVNSNGAQIMQEADVVICFRICRVNTHTTRITYKGGK